MSIEYDVHIVYIGRRVGDGGKICHTYIELDELIGWKPNEHRYLQDIFVERQFGRNLIDGMAVGGVVQCNREDKTYSNFKPANGVWVPDEKLLGIWIAKDKAAQFESDEYKRARKKTKSVVDKSIEELKLVARELNPSQKAVFISRVLKELL